MDRTLPQLPVLGSTTSAPSGGGGVRTLVDEFLAEQASTTAVERYATAHDALDESATPVQARWYRDLLPATPPGDGQQWAFEVDLDACSGCKACVTACHSLNGLDDDAAWRSVGLLTGTADRAVVQPVTTGCHHCADPGCLSGCPVDAYVKHDDGVVEHLDDQCIGCTYCTLTCPYEVPQYDAGRGIVRKCDLCHDRLAEGEAPACVQACPTEAIRITVVDVADAGRADWGFAAPDPAATRPSTVFRSTRDLSTDVAPVDDHLARPRHAHPPLVAMLVLTQLAVGTFVGVEVLRLVGALDAAGAVAASVVALLLTGLALLASLAHLGRPHLAWRAVLGLRHSWLSREIVAFGAFAPLGALHAVRMAGVVPVLDVVPPVLTGVLAGVTGLAALGTSVMVYVATRREGWGPVRVGTRFVLTAVGLGAPGTAVAGRVLGVDLRALGWLVAVAAVAAAAALVVDLLARCPGPAGTTRARTAALLRGPLDGLVRLRTGAGLLCIALMAGTGLLLARGGDGPVVVFAVGGLLLGVLAEAVARWWFFAAEGSPRMPGVR